jgi:hypothetical protein
MFSNHLGLNLLKGGWQPPGVFSATPSHVKGRWEPNLITFLASVQKFQVRILPISWHPGLESLGEGGSATLSQSIVTAARCLAFKRFRRTEDPAERFESLTTEIEILSQPLVLRHPNIVDLEGVCWEVDRHTRDIAPVLVFEKAQWDMGQLMETPEGKGLSMDQKLQLYVQVGGGFLALHNSGLFPLRTLQETEWLSEFRNHPWGHQASEYTCFQRWNWTHYCKDNGLWVFSHQ